MAKMTKARTVAALLFLAVALLSLGVYTIWRSSGGSTDFDTYYYASLDIRHGAPIYADQPGRSPYLYPPLFACLMIIFTLFDIRTAAFMWYCLSVLLFAASVIVSADMIKSGAGGIKSILKSARLIPKMLFLTVLAGIFLDNISMLQVNILVFCLSLLALYFLNKNMTMACAAFLAAAISIKIIPVVFLAYLAVKKKFRAAFLTIVFTLIFSIAVPAVVMGPVQAYRTFEAWTGKIFMTSMSPAPEGDVLDSMFSPSNQSIEAAISRLFVKNDYKILVWKRINRKYPPFLVNPIFPLSVAQASAISGVIMFLFAAAGLLLLRPRSCSPPQRQAIEYSVVFMLGLMLNPILRTQQFVFMLFPAMTALALCGTTDRVRGKQYYLYILFAVSFILQAVPILKVMGFGALSMVFLWYTVSAEAASS